MPKGVDKLRKEYYKQSRLKGNSVKQSLLNAGYSEAHAEKSTANKVVKDGETEIMEYLKASDISVDWVVGKLNQELLNIHAKSSDRVRILELLGKYLNMFKDSNTTQTIVFTQDITKDLPPIDITEVKPSNEPKPIC